MTGLKLFRHLDLGLEVRLRSW